MKVLIWKVCHFSLNNNLENTICLLAAMPLDRGRTEISTTFNYIHQLNPNIMKTIYSVLAACGLSLLISCQKQTTSLTEDQKKQLADSAQQVVQQVLELSSKLDFKSALNFYSADTNARFIENGSIFPSLDAMRTAYERLEPAIELLENKVDKWDILVLSKDAVSITTPIHFKIKAKGLSEYNGQYVWSGIIRKENGKWIIFQAHESWLNYAEAMAALTPQAAEEKK